MIKCYQNFIKIPSKTIFRIKKLYSQFKNYIQNLKILLYPEFSKYVQPCDYNTNHLYCYNYKAGYNHIFCWDLTSLNSYRSYCLPHFKKIDSILQTLEKRVLFHISRDICQHSQCYNGAVTFRLGHGPEL
jgi:hypothetical protein